MHGALFLDEILRVIFDYCYPQPHYGSRSGASDLVALATTCRTFKEPALDLLWAELEDPDPLVRCLPEVCCSKGLDPDYQVRPLKESDRDAVKRYTCRIRYLKLYLQAYDYLDSQSLAELFSPSTTGPFFPNLCQLEFLVIEEALPLIHHIASPKLKYLCLHSFLNLNKPSFESLLYSLGSGCPNMETIDISVGDGKFPTELNHIMIQQIHRWNRLWALDCFQASLGIDTLAHLSRIPSLHELEFALGYASTEKITFPSHPLVFSALEQLTVASMSITAVSELLTYMSLPALERAYVSFDIVPPPQSIKSLSLALLKTCGNLFRVSATQNLFMATENVGRIVLVPDDIRPLTTFNLTCISINLAWAIGLSDSSLLELASSWPRLSNLYINETFGWRTPGITPRGLVQVLQECPLLYMICVALDTRGFRILQTETSHPIVKLLMLNIADSVIEAESIPALVSFFADQFMHKDTTLNGWNSSEMDYIPGSQIYKKRWKYVAERVEQTMRERRGQVDSDSMVSE